MGDDRLHCMIYLLTILFTIWFVFYSKYQFEERNGTSRGKWHLWGWMMRATFFVPFIIYCPNHKTDIILAAAITILLWEMLINLIALKEKIFHVGTVSQFDRRLGKMKWIVCIAFLIAAIIMKVLKVNV
jgi:hypothetical protein